jgi:tripartite-type tricarboxylate transporter receptor subunit TctC
MMRLFRRAAPRRRAAMLGLCTAACVALFPSASAQTQTGARTAGGYPAKPIHLIVPFPPGGATDILARSVAERLSARLAQPVIIDNKPGAGANIGAEAAAKSAPDGYTLLMGSVASHSISLSYYRKLGYDIRRDLTPISMAGYITNVLVVTPNLPVNSVKELIALAKAKPGQLNFASSGTGGLIHLTGELFKQMAGIDIVHVPYKGTALFLPDLMKGDIAMSLDTLPPHLPHIKAGKLRALAVTTRQRSPVMPDLPTMAEAGLPGFESVAIYALFAPAGTPKDIIALLNREANVVLQQADLRDRLAGQGIEIAGSTPEAVQAVVVEEVAKWARVIKQGNIQPE